MRHYNGVHSLCADIGLYGAGSDKVLEYRDFIYEQIKDDLDDITFTFGYDRGAGLSILKTTMRKSEGAYTASCNFNLQQIPTNCGLVITYRLLRGEHWIKAQDTLITTLLQEMQYGAVMASQIARYKHKDVLVERGWLASPEFYNPHSGNNIQTWIKGLGFDHDDDYDDEDDY